MKSTIMMMCMFLIQPTISLAGAKDHGGGDPKIISARPFHKKALLRQSINHLKEAVERTEYPRRFLEEFIEELENLQSERKILYVPEVMSLGYSRYVGDYTKLVSLGAFTRHLKGEPIYLSKRVDSYSHMRLAQVLAQEVPHHVLPSSIKYNEDFVNRLGESLANGRTDEELIDVLTNLYGDKLSVVTCNGEIWREDYSTGTRRVVTGVAKVSLVFRFDLSHFQKTKNFNGSDVFSYDATVEERIYNDSLDSASVMPVIHQNITLKKLGNSTQVHAYGLNLKFGIRQLNTYGPNDSSGYFFFGETQNGSFDNIKGYDYTAMAASNYRYAILTCQSLLNWPNN